MQKSFPLCSPSSSSQIYMLSSVSGRVGLTCCPKKFQIEKLFNNFNFAFAVCSKITHAYKYEDHLFSPLFSKINGSHPPKLFNYFNFDCSIYSPHSKITDRYKYEAITHLYLFGVQSESLSG